MGQDTQQIRDEIAQTRARMDVTLGELAYQADVRSRLRDNVNAKMARAKHNANRAAEHPLGLALGALGAGLLAGMVVPMRHNGRKH